MSVSPKIIIDGYIRVVQSTLNDVIIPKSIHILCFKFYDPFISLQNCPDVHGRTVTPWYSKVDKKWYILIISYGIRKYDPCNNELVEVIKYPSFNFQTLHICLNVEEDILYFVNGHTLKQFLLYDLNANKWNIILDSTHKGFEYWQIYSKYKIDVFDAYVSCAYIPSPLNEMHYYNYGWYGRLAHYKYDKSLQQFIQATPDEYSVCPKSKYLSRASMVYVKSKNMLLLLSGYSEGGNTNRICFCKMDKNNEHKQYIWKTNENWKLPFKQKEISCSVAFDSILFVCDKMEGIIYFIDLGRDVKLEKINKNSWISFNVYNKGCKIVIVESWIYLMSNRKSEKVHLASMSLKHFLFG